MVLDLSTVLDFKSVLYSSVSPAGAFCGAESALSVWARPACSCCCDGENWTTFDGQNFEKNPARCCPWHWKSIDCVTMFSTSLTQVFVSSWPVLICISGTTFYVVPIPNCITRCAFSCHCPVNADFFKTHLFPLCVLCDSELSELCLVCLFCSDNQHMYLKQTLVVLWVVLGLGCCSLLLEKRHIKIHYFK